MNTEDIIARVSTTIDASADEVWEALVNPEIIKQYMFGTEVVSDFNIGSPITWKGEWEGKRYEDKGEIREYQKDRLLQYTHYSPLTGEKDLPENYHIVTIILVEIGGETNVTLTQDNNPTDKSREHSEKNWKMMLEGLKKTVERNL
ncbi:MAG: SRPBCC domain-containing protein [Bacteroidota bacterium]